MSRHRRRSLGPDFGYVPGEQPPDGPTWIKLNTNESPLSPSPRVASAVSHAIERLHRYPDPQGEPLRSALARHHGLPIEAVMVGNGADQVLESCFRAFADPGDTVVLTRPTYSLLPVLARLGGVRIATVPLARRGASAGRPGDHPRRDAPALQPQLTDRELGAALGRSSGSWVRSTRWW